MTSFKVIYPDGKRKKRKRGGGGGGGCNYVTVID
jgi:hypothetical protein